MIYVYMFYTCLRIPKNRESQRFFGGVSADFSILFASVRPFNGDSSWTCLQPSLLEEAVGFLATDGWTPGNVQDSKWGIETKSLTG